MSKRSMVQSPLWAMHVFLLLLVVHQKYYFKCFPPMYFLLFFYITYPETHHLIYIVRFLDNEITVKCAYLTLLTTSR